MLSFAKDFVRRIFKREEDMSDNNTASKPRKHKFEIQVYEADWEKADRNNGQPVWRAVRSDPQLDGGRPTTIEVSSKKELHDMQQQYAMCDQRFKIIREIDPFPFEDDVQKPSAGSIPDNNKAIPVNQQVSLAPAAQPASAPASAPAPAPASAPVPNPYPAPAPAKSKPKIVTIGDIEVKYDGDKVYQKQWMKLTPAEASNFRIVSDSSNKIVSLNGKHLEAKRWTLVEESTSSSDDSIESIIGE